ncbi:MAG: hypothetical protein K2Y37_11165 [Pirellulales bacterium]|nr:hypothetical protein [Pirellulales bacterium]
MQVVLKRLWKEQEGVLTFEWILLITVLAIGIVGGLSAVRDAIISELGDVAQAIVHLDQSYLILPPVEAVAHDTFVDGGTFSIFTDTICNTAGSCRFQGQNFVVPNQIVVDVNCNLQ